MIYNNTQIHAFFTRTTSLLPLRMLHVHVIMVNLQFLTFLCIAMARLIPSHSILRQKIKFNNIHNLGILDLLLRRLVLF